MTIVNNTVNDVAATVLPDAPIDPATGLPVPTIAVATAGGVSVIKDDGTVVDITAANSTYGLSRQVHIDRQQGLWFELGNSSQNGGSWVYYFATMPSADTTLTQDSKVGTGADATAYFTDVLGYGDLQYLGDGGFFSSDVILSEGVIGGKGTRAKGLNRVSVNATTPSEGMVAYTTSTYNTGWMNGDIKGAFLADTDDTDLVGSGELVTNGTFDTDTDWTKGTGWTISGGVLNATAAAQNTVASQDITTVVGQTYTVTVDITVSLGTFRFYITEGGTAKANTDNVTVVDDGKYVLTWTATSTTATIKPYSWGASGNSGTFDNISVKLADPDRSVNNNGLIVNGTITRSPVSSGADLVGYSGFSASNYLEQPYNSALDFGTGDFCVMGWVKGTDASGKLFVRHDGTSSTDRIIIDVASGGYFRFYVDVASGLVTSTTLATTNTWIFVAGVRVGTTLYLYVNGALNASVTHAVNGYDLSNSNAVVNIGEHPDLSDPYGGSLALLRISATAPTASQIEKIYEDEKVLFQENAAATLYGTSDAVTALAHDEDTGLLHVGTSAGRSVFQGLRRVSNTTTAVGTAISASGGLVVEE